MEVKRCLFLCITALACTVHPRCSSSSVQLLQQWLNIITNKYRGIILPLNMNSVEYRSSMLIVYVSGFKCEQVNNEAPYLPVWSQRASSCLHWLVPARILLWLVVLWSGRDKTEQTTWVSFFFLLQKLQNPFKCLSVGRWSSTFSPLNPLGFCPRYQYKRHPLSSRFLHPNHVPESEHRAHLNRQPAYTRHRVKAILYASVIPPCTGDTFLW